MRLLTFEEHSSVLAAWWSLASGARTLLYFDAHLDLQQVSTQRLGRLEACTSPQDVAELNKPHHLCPDHGFSYSLEDFLYPSHRLGLIERIIWVAPPHVNTAYTHAAFERLQQMDGVQFEELLSFRRVQQSWIEGRLLGVDLTICDYRQLEKMKLPADTLVDIDTDFFIALPDDAPWLRPFELFRELAALSLTPELVTISRSVNSGFTPLRYRFLADHLAALYAGRTADSGHFDRLFDLDALARAGDREAAATGCRSELEWHRTCPATWHLLSLTASDLREVQAAQHQAAALCPAYHDSILREACAFPARHLPLELPALRALEERFVVGHRSDLEDALTWTALGLLHGHLGRVNAVRECYRQVVRHFGAHPELAFALAKALLQAQRPAEALPLLQVALADDKTAAGAHMLMGTILASAGDASQALAHWQAASALAPAWPQLLDLRSALHAAMGDHREATRLRQRRHEFRQQELGLAQRLQRG
ncbi:MAG TPA: hypothetical protein VFV87_10895 [Pirellulaceae bacterium]|nr:hypothetical protein [Pirellulaceae bacterium]